MGTARTGSSFDLGDKVSYKCSSSNLVLTGSAERECQSNGVWSGSEPICRRECLQCPPRPPCPGLVLAGPHVTLFTEPYSYDFPEDVASALGTSFNNLLGTINPTQKRTGECRRRGLEGAGERQDTRCTQGGAGHLTPRFLFASENLGRRIQIQRSGHLNLYLLLDASQSVSEEDFEIFKESASLMVDRVRNQGQHGFSTPLILHPSSEPQSAHLLLEVSSGHLNHEFNV